MVSGSRRRQLTQLPLHSVQQLRERALKGDSTLIVDASGVAFLGNGDNP